MPGSKIPNLGDLGQGFFFFLISLKYTKRVLLFFLMLKLKLQYFGHLMQRTDSLEKTLTMGKIEGKRRRE